MGRMIQIPLVESMQSCLVQIKCGQSTHLVFTPVNKYLMLKEWLLIAWTGTTTNFVLLDHFPSLGQCDQQRQILLKDRDPTIELECRQDMREGRSTLPARNRVQGIATK